MILDIVPLYRDTDTLIDEWDAVASFEQLKKKITNSIDIS